MDMENSNTIELFERMRQTLRKYAKTEEDFELLIDIDDKIMELEIAKRTLNDFYGIKNAFTSNVLTAHIQKNNRELISRCILKQPENKSKTKTWKEFCEEENNRRIEDLEKENKRLKEEIQKSNNESKVKIISSNVRREFETAITLFVSGKKVKDIKCQVVYRGDKLGILYTALIMYEGGQNND